MELTKELLVPMNIQMFADGDGTDTPPADDTGTDDKDKQNEQGEKTFTRSDIAKMIAAEKSKWEQEYEAKVEKERNEAAELAKLSEKDRQKALIQKEKDEFEKEKAAFRKEQLTVEKGKQLTIQGMPASFVHRVVGETAEDILEDVKAFRKEWDEGLEAKVNERLASKNATRVGNSGGQMTKTEIMAIKDSDERQRLIRQNRDLFLGGKNK